MEIVGGDGHISLGPVYDGYGFLYALGPGIGPGFQQKGTDVFRAALGAGPDSGLLQSGKEVSGLLVFFHIGADHIQVVLSENHGREVGRVSALTPAADLGPPVRHNNARKAPLLPQDPGVEVIGSGGPDAVDGAVGGHDSISLPLGDGNLEALKVDLPQSPLGHHVVELRPLGLLVIAAEMLDAARHSGAVKAPELGGGNLAGEERILGEVLEVPAI